MSKDENAKKNTATTQHKIAEMMCMSVYPLQGSPNGNIFGFLYLFFFVSVIFKGHVKSEITNVENIQIELYMMIR